MTLELGQTFMEISSENGDRLLRETFPKGMSAASVDEHYLLGGSQKLLFHPLGVVQEHVVHLQSGQDTLSVYIPATERPASSKGSFLWNRFARSSYDVGSPSRPAAHAFPPGPLPFRSGGPLCRFRPHGGFRAVRPCANKGPSPLFRPAR